MQCNLYHVVICEYIEKNFAVQLLITLSCTIGAQVTSLIKVIQKQKQNSCGFNKSIVHLADTHRLLYCLHSEVARVYISIYISIFIYIQ